MLEVGAFLAAHVFHEIAADKTEVFLDLFDETVAVFKVQVSETENFLQVVGQ